MVPDAMTAHPSAGLPQPRSAADGWSIGWACAEDDEGIRSLLRKSVIPGGVRVAFTREPNDSAGAGLAGGTDLTLVARNRNSVAGLGRCSIYSLHRNGKFERVGYLSALRLLPGAPASPRLLRDGYRALAGEAGARGVDGFVTAIADDNVRARRVLEQGGRFGLPSYRRLASLVTLVSPVGRRVSRSPNAVRQDTEESSGVDAEELTTFLRTHAPGAQLTLQWDAGRWSALAFHGVTPAHFVVVRRRGVLVAAAAIWDQRPFRQTIVDGYEGALRTWRPMVNVLQRLRAQPLLPAPGSQLAQGALFAATVPDARDWPALWTRLHERARSAALDWLLLTRDARAPELGVLQRLSGARTYETTLYEVAWRDHPSWTDGWDERLFAPEVGLL